MSSPSGPTIRRYGVFGNYLFFDKLDVLGGYLRSRDDWKDAVDGETTHFTSNGYRAEVDYYIQRGFAVDGPLRPAEPDASPESPPPTRRPGASAAQKALTQIGQCGHPRDLQPRARHGSRIGLGNYRQAVQSRSAIDVVRSD